MTPGDLRVSASDKLGTPEIPAQWNQIGEPMIGTGDMMALPTDTAIHNPAIKKRWYQVLVLPP